MIDVLRMESFWFVWNNGSFLLFHAMASYIVVRTWNNTFIFACVYIRVNFIFQNQRISISKQSTVIGWQVLCSLFLNLNLVVLLAEAFCSPFTFVHGIEVDFGVLHWMHGGVSAQLHMTSVRQKRHANFRNKIWIFLPWQLNLTLL